MTGGVGGGYGTPPPAPGPGRRRRSPERLLFPWWFVGLGVLGGLALGRLLG